MIIKYWLESAKLKLNQSDSAKTDALIMLMHVLNKDKSWIYAFDDELLTDHQISTLNELLTRRMNGEPMAYIIGYKYFWNLKLNVTKATLIPRADTELIVELALKNIFNKTQKILDLGTGSGAIALSIASEKKNNHVIAIDKSLEALNIAKINATLNNISNVSFVLSDWFELVKNYQFDVIVSNPPYIDPADPHLNQGDLRFEPITALSSNDKGLHDITQIIKNAVNHLNNNGLLLIEHGYNQAFDVQNLFKHYQYNEIKTYQDYGGNDRVTLARFSK